MLAERCVPGSPVPLGPNLTRNSTESWDLLVNLLPALVRLVMDWEGGCGGETAGDGEATFPSLCCSRVPAVAPGSVRWLPGLGGPVGTVQCAVHRVAPAGTRL